MSNPTVITFQTEQRHKTRYVRVQRSKEWTKKCWWKWLSLKHFLQPLLRVWSLIWATQNSKNGLLQTSIWGNSQKIERQECCFKIFYSCNEVALKSNTSDRTRVSQHFPAESQLLKFEQKMKEKPFGHFFSAKILNSLRSASSLWKRWENEFHVAVVLEFVQK